MSKGIRNREKNENEAEFFFRSETDKQYDS